MKAAWLRVSIFTDILLKFYDIMANRQLEAELLLCESVFFVLVQKCLLHNNVPFY